MKFKLFFTLIYFGVIGNIFSLSNFLKQEYFNFIWVVKSDMEKNPFSYFRYFSFIDRNEDGFIDFQEIKIAYENKFKDYEVNFIMILYLYSLDWLFL